MKRFSLPIAAASAAALAFSSAASHAAILLHNNFDVASPAAWPSATASGTGKGVTATVSRRAAGTVDVANTDTPSGAIVLAARPGAGGGKSGGTAILSSGLLPIHSSETNLGKLTLAFSLSATGANPVTVKVESFDAKRKRTGGLTGVIYPAAPNFYQRYALDLSTMKPVGMGKFQPTAPFVQFSYETSVSQVRGVTGSMTATPAVGEYLLRLDNVQYATPAFYVSPKGSDTNDGKTEATAFATPQKALDVAQPGDITVLRTGTYKAGLVPVASFPRPGAPDAWIVLKNYPGEHPTLSSNGWNIISIAQGSKEKISESSALAYLEVRGLHVRGEGDVAKAKYPEAMNKSDSRTNSNGIAVDGRYSKNIFHDFRFADNLIEFAPGCGIGSIDGDWVTVENNICRSNCWTTIYAPSGISVMGPRNFDTQVNVYKRLVRNNICCHNQTYEMWAAIKRYSDGNGIILDVNQGSDEHKTINYTGRTLVQSNLSYDNGGSGIHTVTADRVDIINNTVYFNSASVHLEYGAIFTYGSKDVHITNNIMVARVANTAAGEKPEPLNRLGGKNVDVVFSHNLYFGGNIAPTLGEGDEIGDPMFAKPGIDDATADFHLMPGSPAIGKGITTPLVPFLDLDGKPRKTTTPALGAYEK